jgi:hypothetical protein
VTKVVSGIEVKPMLRNNGAPIVENMAEFSQSGAPAPFKNNCIALGYDRYT